MNSIGVMILLAIVIAMYAVYIFNIFKRNDFYEIVYKRLLDVATRATVKNRECIYDILNYTNTSRLDKISITEYKKVISKKIAYYQKRDKLENKVADEIIDCVFKSWLKGGKAMICRLFESTKILQKSFVFCIDEKARAVIYSNYQVCILTNVLYRGGLLYEYG